ncbi:hypothetical protein [Lysobacter xanthus]
MPHPTPTPRPLRRLRRLLALLGFVTAALIAAACRLHAGGRAMAAVAAAICLIGWLALLDVEGRAAERLERHARRRAAARRPAHRRLHASEPRHAGPKKQTARSVDRAV